MDVCISESIQFINYLPPTYLFSVLLHASIFFLMLVMQVKNLPLTRPNIGKDVRHFEFEFVSHVSYPMSLDFLYLYIINTKIDVTLFTVSHDTVQTELPYLYYL